jgi:NADPH:quinone reductase-like Zn-dependent oxidoreductase
MKAVVQDRFGSPDVLQLMDVDPPAIGSDEVLVRVHAAAINPYDWHMLRGDPYVARLMGGVGLTRPKHRIAGADGAGRVERVGAGVSDLRPGDEVLGWFDGSFAEYARAAADRVVPKPASLSFEEAAAVPMAGETALRAIRDVGEVQPGHRVLVNGAAGGVGHLAVQIAVALGAEVTGVCSTRNVELVRSLGAAQVVDYTEADFTDGRQHYDVVLDNVGNQPLRRLRRALTPTGTLVHNAGGAPGHVFGPVGSILRVLAVNGLVSQRLRPLPSDWTREHLLAVTELVGAGQLAPVVDRTFPLADTAAGLHHVEQGHARGKVVVTVL